MKQVRELSPEWIRELKDLEESSKESYRTRRRAQAIRLSFQGNSINELARIYNVNRNTIGIWISNWEDHQFSSLYDLPGKGRKSMIQPEEHDKIVEWVEATPQQLKTVLVKIEEHFQKKISTKTLQRFLKKRLRLETCKKVIKNKEESGVF